MCRQALHSGPLSHTMSAVHYRQLHELPAAALTRANERHLADQRAQHDAQAALQREALHRRLDYHCVAQLAGAMRERGSGGGGSTRMGGVVNARRVQACVRAGKRRRIEASTAAALLSWRLAAGERQRAGTAGLGSRGRGVRKGRGGEGEACQKGVEGRARRGKRAWRGGRAPCADQLLLPSGNRGCPPACVRTPLTRSTICAAPGSRVTA